MLHYRLVLRIMPPDDSKSQCPLGMKFGCLLREVRKLLKIAQELSLDVIGVRYVEFVWRYMWQIFVWDCHVTLMSRHHKVLASKSEGHQVGVYDQVCSIPVKIQRYVWWFTVGNPIRVFAFVPCSHVVSCCHVNHVALILESSVGSSLVQYRVNVSKHLVFSKPICPKVLKNGAQSSQKVLEFYHHMGKNMWIVLIQC